MKQEKKKLIDLKIGEKFQETNITKPRIKTDKIAHIKAYGGLLCIGAHTESSPNTIHWYPVDSEVIVEI